MRSATRFSVAVHILTLLGYDEEQDTTSEGMALSIGVNPVVVRNVTGMLRRAGLTKSHQGVPGTNLARPLHQITLLDVYRAVEPEGSIFAIHAFPNPTCPVGENIEEVLGVEFAAAQSAMENRLKGTNLASIAKGIKSLAEI